MSGEGAPKVNVDGSGLNLAIIASRWHDKIMDGLIDGAVEAATEAGATHKVFRVAGSFELPIVAQWALNEGFDGAVCLGVIIRGETPHFDYVCNAVTDGLTRVALDTTLPVGFGVLTVDDEEQALDRAGLPGSKESKGRETVEAVLDTWTAFNEISEYAEETFEDELPAENN